MNNLPLKPLVWDVHEVAATINMTAESPLHSYTIYPDQYEGGYVIYYFERMTNESGREYFNSSDEAQEWAQFTHYPSKMQPYVKPMPTWIDVSERLPEEDGLYLAYYPDQLHKQQIVFFSLNINKFNYFHDLVKHWQPLPNPPEFSTMQICIKESDR